MAAAKNPPRGENHYACKLTDDDVRLVRECVALRKHHLAEAKKLSDAALASKFEVHRRTIYKISSFAGRIDA